jgi:hypothetical protein
MERNYTGPERRESIRLKQTIPVEFSLISDERVAAVSGKRKAVIQNISAGGVRMEVEGLEAILIEGLRNGMIKVGLQVSLPNSPEPLRILARALWITKSLSTVSSGKPMYILGLKFIDITTAYQDVIREYVTKFFLEQ